ncbi:MAG: hypothetical protein LBM65_05705 [Oscillospiraceae bacterium]|jgi:hypothetical protein|nr:hypothetical protein [Oscillospiraceae bacterium]
MSNIQERKLNKIIHSWLVEGFITPDDEKKILIEILEGTRSYKDVLNQYLAEAKAYAGV